MANTVEVVLCRCPGAQENPLDEGRLLELLSKNKRVSKAVVIEHLCSAEGVKRLTESIDGGKDAGLVVAACAADPLYRLLKPHLETLGIPRQAFEVVPIRDWALWAHPGERAMNAANDAIRMATARVKASKDIGQWNAGSAYINKLGCDKCKRCVEECPVKACVLDEDGYPIVKQELCQRCGMCVGSCPKQVISLPDLRIEEISAGLRVLKGDGSEEPTIVAFCCEPLTFPALTAKVAQGLTLPNNLRIVKVSCMGAVNMALVSDALSSGVDSVLFFGCKDGPCRLRQGDELAARRLDNLRETLDRMMIDMSRVRYIGWPEAVSDGVAVNFARCNGCLTCQAVCPFGAVEAAEKKVAGKNRKVAERKELTCRSCGVCVASCPSGAAQPIGSSDRQLMDEIDAACWDGFQPVAGEVVVLCNCMGALNDKIDFSHLESNLREEGIDRVLLSDRLCAPEGWVKVREALGAELPHTMVVGACAEEFFGPRMRKYAREAGLSEVELGFTEASASEIFSCAARMKRAIQVGQESGCELAVCLAEQVAALKLMGPNPFRE